MVNQYLIFKNEVVARLALETEIIAAMQYDQARALARKERNSMQVDAHGNLAYEHE